MLEIGDGKVFNWVKKFREGQKHPIKQIYFDFCKPIRVYNAHLHGDIKQQF